MRSISYWLSVAVLLAPAACRLDLAGQSADEPAQREDADQRARDDKDSTAMAGGPTTDKGDGSGLSCGTAAILRTATELKDRTAQLSGAYHVTGQVILTGEVTIAPGTIFIVDADSSIDIGWNSTRTTLTALGTEAKPIQFCSDKPILGRWQGLRLSRGLTTDSVLQHAHIYDAGKGAAALTVIAPVSLIDVTIHGSSSDGVVADAFGDDSSGLTVNDARGAAVVLEGQVAVDKFPPGSKFKGNADNSAHIRFRNYNGGSVHFANLGIPYVQDQGMIAYNVVLDFEAGVEYRFAVDTGLEVGWNSNQATLNIPGTAAKPVVFRGLTDKKGSWNGVLINKNVSTDSSLSNVQVINGGKQTPPLVVSSSVTLSDVSVSDCATAPVISAPLTAESQNFSVSGSDTVALVSNVQSLSGLPRGGTFTGNARDLIELPKLSPFDSLGKATIPNLGVPYYFTGDIAIGAGSDVTIEPGVEFIAQSGNPYLFEIGWNGSEVMFTARGTATQPIIFRGEKDDVGTWKGIQIGSAVSTNSVFDHVEVRNAGLSTRAQVTIQNSTFSKSPGFGIAKAKADTTDYTATNTFSGNAQGDVGVQ